MIIIVIISGISLPWSGFPAKFAHHASFQVGETDTQVIFSYFLVLPVLLSSIVLWFLRDERRAYMIC